MKSVTGSDVESDQGADARPENSNKIVIIETASEGKYSEQKKSEDKNLKKLNPIIKNAKLLPKTKLIFPDIN